MPLCWVILPYWVTVMYSNHNLPKMIRNIILTYYNNFVSRVTSGLLTSAWHWLENGLITGYTVISQCFSSRWPLTWLPNHLWWNVEDPSVDLALMDNQRGTFRMTLSRARRTKFIPWIRMFFWWGFYSPEDGKSGWPVPLYLGRDLDSNNDRKKWSIVWTRVPWRTLLHQQSRRNLTAWLSIIDKSVALRKFNAWRYQHAKLWPLIVYKISVTTVKMVRAHFMSNGFQNPCIWLPISGLVQKF